METEMKRILAAIGVTGLVLLGATAPAAATDDEEKGDHKVTICHATGSDTNPYVQITVDWHALKAHHSEHWGDIIPGGHKWGGQNWDVDGQAIYYNGCVPCPPEEEPEPEPEEPPAEPEEPPVVPEEPPVVPEEPPVVPEEPPVVPEEPPVAPEEPTVVTPQSPIGAVQRPVVAAPVVVNNPGFNVQTAVAPSDGGLAPWAAGLIVMVLAAGGVAARRLMPADGAVSREGND
jgi:hypothetical protein